MGPKENGSPLKKGTLPRLLLPGSFLDFLQENGLDPSIYAMVDTIPRYIRLKSDCESQLLEIEDELKCKLEKVVWLPGFFAIPPNIQIASSNAYQFGKIFGMDASSGAAVIALNASPGDHVLDLCAAPVPILWKHIASIMDDNSPNKGAKLCMLSDLLGKSGSLTGVDVARHRLAACRTMLQKYALGDRCRLFVADGTKFSLLPLRSHADIKSCETDTKDIANTFTEWTSKRSWKDRKNAVKARNNTGSRATSEPELIFYGRHSGVVGLRRTELFHAVDAIDTSNSGYDRVLVDAECTHDGSIKHIQKFEYWGWKTLQRRVLDAKRTDNLMHLQLQLLNNGFRLLKVGGSLVYSTCSLTVAQNEDVVEQFLSTNPSAELQEVDAAVNWCCKSGMIPKTLRFDPKVSRTSGLFIAKLTKLAI